MKEHAKKVLKHDTKVLGKTVPTMLIIGLFLVGGGSAALLSSFGTVSGEADVDQAIELDSPANFALSSLDVGETEAQTVSFSHNTDQPVSFQWEVTETKDGSSDTQAFDTRVYRDFSYGPHSLTTETQNDESAESGSIEASMSDSGRVVFDLNAPSDSEKDVDLNSGVVVVDTDEDGETEFQIKQDSNSETVYYVPHNYDKAGDGSKDTGEKTEVLEMEEIEVEETSVGSFEVSASPEFLTSDFRYGAEVNVDTWNTYDGADINYASGDMTFKYYDSSEFETVSNGAVGVVRTAETAGGVTADVEVVPHEDSVEYRVDVPGDSYGQGDHDTFDFQFDTDNDGTADYEVKYKPSKFSDDQEFGVKELDSNEEKTGSWTSPSDSEVFEAEVSQDDASTLLEVEVERADGEPGQRFGFNAWHGNSHEDPNDNFYFPKSFSYGAYEDGGAQTMEPVALTGASAEQTVERDTDYVFANDLSLIAEGGDYEMTAEAVPITE
jgi:hypothetical protein